MGTGFFDWKGNEVKSGMTIYFVRTKPMLIGKFGFLMPKTGEMIWESDEDYEKRSSEKVWYLGTPYEVIWNNGFYLRSEEEGYTFTAPLTSPYFSTDSTIAIKGLSDKSE